MSLSGLPNGRPSLRNNPTFHREIAIDYDEVLAVCEKLRTYKLKWDFCATTRDVCLNEGGLSWPIEMDLFTVFLLLSSSLLSCHIEFLIGLNMHKYFPANFQNDLASCQLHNMSLHPLNLTEMTNTWVKIIKNLFSFRGN